MGSEQSKTTPEVTMHEKAVLQRLRAMQLENKGDDYVLVDGDNNEKRSAGAASVVRQAEDLSVDLMQDWQKRLLDDPKNR